MARTRLNQSSREEEEKEEKKDEVVKGYDPEYDNLNWMIEYDDLTDEQIRKLKDIEKAYHDLSDKEDDET